MPARFGSLKNVVGAKHAKHTSCKTIRPYLRRPKPAFRLRPVHYISILAAIALTAALYWGLPTTPPAGAKGETGGGAHQDAGAQPAMPQVTAASTDSIYTASRAALPAHAADELSAIEHQIAALHDSAQMSPLFDKAAELWIAHKQAPMAVWSRAKAAHLARSEKKLNFAGQFFLDLMHNAETPGMGAWSAAGAIACLSEARTLNENNDTTKLALATAYIEGSGTPMAGVSILREMVAKKPDDVPANLLLGKLSIQSGQWDKAVARLEHVTELEPRNEEGLYYLAEAYKGKGEKDRAIQTLRKLEGIVKKPEFTQETEKYITSFK